MSHIEITYPDADTIDVARGSGIEPQAVIRADADMVRTILYALGEYKKNLQDTVRKAQEDDREGACEDEFWCWQHAAQCALGEFVILFDHEGGRELAAKFIEH